MSSVARASLEAVKLVLGLGLTVVAALLLVVGVHVSHPGAILHVRRLKGMLAMWKKQVRDLKVGGCESELEIARRAKDYQETKGGPCH